MEENVDTSWSNWCRLCAKEDLENNVSIHEQPTTIEDPKFTLKEALEKYFWIQPSFEDLLPEHLCVECYSLISSLMLFNEHVDRVQEMYKFLLDNRNDDSCDLQTIRVKFDVCDDNRGQWCHCQNKISEANSEFNEAIEENCESEEFTVQIKREDWSVESNLSEYEDKDDEYIQHEEVIYDEEHIVNSGMEEGEDPFDTKPEGSYCGEDQEKIIPKETTQKRTSPKTKKSNDADAVRTSKARQCKLKKNIPKDFVSYDKRLTAHNSQEEDKEPFDTMSEDSFWASDDESPRNKNKSVRNKQDNSANKVRTMYPNISSIMLTHIGILVYNLVYH